MRPRDKRGCRGGAAVSSDWAGLTEDLHWERVHACMDAVLSAARSEKRDAVYVGVPEGRISRALGSSDTGGGQRPRSSSLHSSAHVYNRSSRSHS